MIRQYFGNGKGSGSGTDLSSVLATVSLFFLRKGNTLLMFMKMVTYHVRVAYTFWFFHLQCGAL